MPETTRHTDILSGAYLGGDCAVAFGVKKIVLIFNVKKNFMLNFEHFRKFTPEMYPPGPPFETSKYATVFC